MESNQLERQLFIISLISQKGGLTLSDIDKKLKKFDYNVSIKTIKRDIDTISKWIFISEEEINKNTYYFIKEENIKELYISPNQIISFYFAKEILQQYKNITSIDIFLEFIENIIKNYGYINKKEFESFEQTIKIKTRNLYEEKNINHKILYDLKDSIIKCQKVKITYYSLSKSSISERIIEPYIIEIYEGCFHLFAFCLKKLSIRDFRVSRIENLEILDEFFVKDKNIITKLTSKRIMNLINNEKIKLKLLFPKELDTYLKEFEKERFSVFEYTEEGILCEMISFETPELFKWILGFGSNIKVIEPISLKDKVSFEIKKSYENYYGGEKI